MIEDVMCSCLGFVAIAALGLALAWYWFSGRFRP